MFLSIVKFPSNFDFHKLLSALFFFTLINECKSQSLISKHSIYFSYEKKFIEKNLLYELYGPASFYSAKSNGFRVCLGYSLQIKKSNQISIQGGFGQINYGFGLDIKPYQYPEIHNFYLSSGYIPSVHNGSLGLQYSRNIFNKNRFSFVLASSLDVYCQGRYDLLRIVSTRNYQYYNLPAVNPDTIYYDYRITSLSSNKLHLTPTITLQTDVNYKIKIKHSISIGISYTYCLTDFASGYYEMFPTTVSKSSGKWKLRGNSFNISLGYRFLIFRHAQTKN